MLVQKVKLITNHPDTYYQGLLSQQLQRKPGYASLALQYQPYWKKLNLKEMWRQTSFDVWKQATGFLMPESRLFIKWKCAPNINRLHIYRQSAQGHTQVHSIKKKIILTSSWLKIHQTALHPSNPGFSPLALYALYNWVLEFAAWF